jgi:ubiquinone biosynthesis protein UbiJ
LHNVLPTIRDMLHEWTAALLPALHERLTLALNHVLAAEPAAGLRLAPHAGRIIEVRPQSASTPLAAWLPALPVLPPARWRITPAGWLEALAADDAGEPALVLRVSLAAPLDLVQRMLAGCAPEVGIEGDAQLAADAAWLVDNLRWDIEADLERLFGPAVAHQVGSSGRAIAAALRALLARAPASAAAGAAAR